jgi:hypothetical protein
LQQTIAEIEEQPDARAVRIVKQMAQDFFSQGSPFSFIPEEVSITTRQLDEWLPQLKSMAARCFRNVFSDFCQYCAERLLRKVIPLKESSSEISCNQYACSLMQIVFHPFDPKTIASDLDEWRVPREPQKGDMILYLDANGVQTHMAMYVGDGYALSKWGNQTPFACEHRVADVPPEYGVDVRFYRLPAGTPLPSLR